MPMAVSTITQSGQVSLPKQFREILGVKPHDQVAFLSDGERVEVVRVPPDPLTLPSKEAFLAQVRASEQAYEDGRALDARAGTEELRDVLGL